MERTKNRPKPLKKSSKAVMKDYPTLLEKTVKTGTKVSELYGDKAYFRKDILELLEEQNIFKRTVCKLSA